MGVKRNLTISVATHESLAQEDADYWLSKTPTERLNMVEQLRLEAGKFLYDEYPTRFRRILEVVRR